MFVGKQICDECEQPNSSHSTHCSTCGTLLDETLTVTRSFRDELLQRLEEINERVTPMNLTASKVDAVLIEENTGAEFVISHNALGATTVGRDNSSELDLGKIADRSGGVSRNHASLLWLDNLLQVIDHNSKNGTYLNGKRIDAEEPHTIHENDLISFGSVDFVINYCSITEIS